MRKAEKIINGIIWFFGFVICYWLFIDSIFRSAVVQVPGKEQYPDLLNGVANVSITADSWWIHFVVIFLFIFIFKFADKHINCHRAEVRDHSRWILYSIYTVLGLFMILSMRLQPASDPGKLMRIAEEIIDGNVSTFTETSGYMYRYPFQSGMVLIDILLLLIFHENAYLFFQLLNLFASILLTEMAVRIASEILQTSERDICEGARCAFWLRITFLFGSPMLFYTTYNYGTLLSLAFMSVAIYVEILFLKRGKNLYILPAILFSSIGIVIKTNSLILLIAMLLYLVFALIRKNGKVFSTLVLGAALVISYFLLQKSVSLIMESITKVPQPAGMPKLCWIAMGLTSETGYSGLSVQLFAENNFDIESTKAAASQSILNTLALYRHHPGSFLHWLGRKIAFQWSSPDFNGLNLNTNRGWYALLSSFWYSVFYGKVSVILRHISNQLQSILYLGALIYLFLDHAHRKFKSNWHRYFLLVVLIGGFLFHIFWEGGAQYTMPYFLMLISYAVMGYTELIRLDRKDILALGRSKLLWIMIIVFVAVLFSRGTAITANLLGMID